MQKQQIVISGNNIDVLKTYPDNYFDSVVTDCPYGLGKEPNAEELMKDWIEKGYHEISGSGFMGKEWDAFVPQPIFWKEVFRVLKYGGHCLAFYGTRTYDWGVMAMRFAGFEVRDCIQWLYGCLSDDTEILTKSGYIQYHKFKKLPNFEQEEIFIYDIETDIYKWEKPERWNEYNIEQDTAYRIKSDSTDQIVSRNHRCVVEREGKLVFIQAELLSQMEYMPTLSNDLSFIQKGYSEVLQSPMQRTLSGGRLEEMGENRFGYIQFTTKQNKEREQGRKEPCVERGDNLSEQERVLFGSETEICEMPNGVYSNVEERWVCSGVSFSNGETIEQTIIENGVRTSHRPQSNEQRYNEFDAICNEQGTQAVRVRRSYSTTLATITPIEYSGVIFCPTVSTGCFVARRNGKVFITGNSGFPKSHNISKAIDKMYGAEREVVGTKECGYQVSISKKRVEEGYRPNLTKSTKEVDITAPATDQAKFWEGWGSALKPANEPIVLARKPLEKGLSIAENVLKWGTGAINIDGCRISTNEDLNGCSYRGENNKIDDGHTLYIDSSKTKGKYVQPSGRFPANLILTHHPECECVGTKKVKPNNGSGKASEKGGGFNKGMFGDGTSDNIGGGYTDENGEETIEDWICVDGCPIKELDEQSGESKSLNNDKGGASRFFYQAKASKSERNKGLDGFEEKIIEGKDEGQDSRSVAYKPRPVAMANTHPTVKPIKLMQYLVRLVTPPNGIVLDPFVGSGTTGIAAKLEGFNFVGIEQDAEYCKIAQARIENYVEEIQKPTKRKVETDEPITDEITNTTQLGLF